MAHCGVSIIGKQVPPNTHTQAAASLCPHLLRFNHRAVPRNSKHAEQGSMQTQSKRTWVAAIEADGYGGVHAGDGH